MSRKTLFCLLSLIACTLLIRGNMRLLASTTIDDFEVPAYEKAVEDSVFGNEFQVTAARIELSPTNASRSTVRYVQKGEKRKVETKFTVSAVKPGPVGHVDVVIDLSSSATRMRDEKGNGTYSVDPVGSKDETRQLFQTVSPAYGPYCFRYE